MNFFKKFKTQIVGNYIIHEINQLLKNKHTYDYTDYLRIEKSNNSISIIIKFGNDIDLLLSKNFLKYYKRYVEKENKRGYNYAIRIQYVWKIYKSRPPYRFCKHLVNLVNRFNKNFDAKTRNFYLSVYDYIQYNKSFIEYKLKNDSIQSKGITISLLDTSCKINIKI